MIPWLSNNNCYCEPLLDYNVLFMKRDIPLILCTWCIIRFSKRRTRGPRPTTIPRGSGPGAGPDQYSPHGSIENGCDTSPTVTQAPTNAVNGGARSSPHYVTGMNQEEFSVLYKIQYNILRCTCNSLCKGSPMPPKLRHLCCDCHKDKRKYNSTVSTGTWLSSLCMKP